MKEIKNIGKEHRESLEHIRIEEKNDILESELKVANGRIEKVEKDWKRKNLVITGIDIDTKDEKAMKESLYDFIIKTLEVNIKIRCAGKIGAKTCVMEMESMTDKLSVLKSKIS